MTLKILIIPWFGDWEMGKLSFRCFDGGTALSVNYGCNIKSARGTKNFVINSIHSGNRRKFTSMFKCASLALPCASVAGDNRRNSKCP